MYFYKGFRLFLFFKKIFQQLITYYQAPVEYLKGVGPQKADLLKKELNIFSFQHLLEHYPYRHVDKTKVSTIADIDYQTDYVQVAGVLTFFRNGG